MTLAGPAVSLPLSPVSEDYAKVIGIPSSQAKYPRKDNAPDPKGYFAWEEGMPMTFA